MADRFPEQAESDLTYLFDQRNVDQIIKHCYWTWLSQNVMICQCLADHLSASAFSFGKWLICSPVSNHYILLNLADLLLIIALQWMTKLILKSLIWWTVLKFIQGISTNQPLSNWGLCSLLLIKPLLRDDMQWGFLFQDITQWLGYSNFYLPGLHIIPNNNNNSNNNDRITLLL